MKDYSKLAPKTDCEEIAAGKISRHEKSIAARQAFDEWASRFRAFLDRAHELKGEDINRAVETYQPYGPAPAAKQPAQPDEDEVMNTQAVSRRKILGGLISLPAALRAQAQESSSTRLTEDQKRQFLVTAKVSRTRGASRGITGTLRATLTDGRITHDASIQSIDESKLVFQTAMGTELNFRDTWKFDVAGYKLDRLLGLNMVPVSVERKHAGRSACFTWWVDDVLMLELDRVKKKIEPPDVKSWNEQMEIVRVFDQLIFNTDRNLGNLVIDKRWRIWMIDHSRAFRLSHDIREPKNLTRCDRDLLAKMKELTEAQLSSAMGDYLREAEIEAVLARRDKIVKHFEEKGDGFLYDSPRRQA